MTADQLPSVLYTGEWLTYSAHWHDRWQLWYAASTDCLCHNMYPPCTDASMDLQMLSYLATLTRLFSSREHFLHIWPTGLFLQSMAALSLLTTALPLLWFQRKVVTHLFHQLSSAMQQHILTMICGLGFITLHTNLVIMITTVIFSVEAFHNILVSANQLMPI